MEHYSRAKDIFVDNWNLAIDGYVMRSIFGIQWQKRFKSPNLY